MLRLLCILLLLVFSAEPLDALDGASFAPLDGLGRARFAVAWVDAHTLDSERGSIRGILPTGYEAVETETGGWYWNRCHLIGAQLAHGTEVPENIVTGTSWMNHALMQPVENQIAAYVARTGNHVLYIVEPDFAGDELICRGIWLRAYSIEDDELRIALYAENAPGPD